MLSEASRQIAVLALEGLQKRYEERERYPYRHDAWYLERIKAALAELQQPPAPQAMLTIPDEVVPKPVLDAIELMVIDWDDRFDAGDWQWIEKWIVKEWLAAQRPQ